MKAISRRASNSPSIQLLLVFGAMLLFSASARAAANDSWTGATSVNWADSNWTGGNNPPQTGDSLIFGTTDTSGTSIIDNLMTQGTYTINGITFAAGAPTFNISAGSVGGNPSGFTLGGGITNSSTNLQTINDNIALSANVTTTLTAAGGSIALGGTLSGAHWFATAGSGTLTITGNNSALTGQSITESGALSNFSAEINSATTVLAVGGADALGTGGLYVNASGTLESVAGGGTISGLIAENNLNYTIAGSNNLTLSGSYVWGGGNNLIVNNTGTTTFSGTTAVRIQSASTRTATYQGSGYIVVSGPIIDGTTGATATVAYVGTGTFDLSGSNTYHGGSNLVQGVTIFDNSGNTNASMAGGTVTIGATGTASMLLVKGNYTIGSAGAAALTFASGTTNGMSVATLSMVDGSINTLNINSTTANATVLTISGSNTLDFEVGSAGADEINLVTTGLKLGTIGANNNVNIVGLGNLNAGMYTIIQSGTNTAFTVSNSGSNGTEFYLTTSGNFGGYTVNLAQSSGKLQVSVGSLVATPATAVWSGSVSSVWNAFTNGNANNTNWLTGTTGGVDTHQTPGATTNVLFNENSGATNTTTTLGAATTINSLEFTSAAVGSGDVSIGGVNALTINASGTNYEGVAGVGITVDAGAGTQVISAPITLGGNQAWMINNSQSNPFTVNGAVGGGHALTIGGPGEVILSASNSYTGNTTVNNGVLDVTGVLYPVTNSATVTVSGTGAGTTLLEGTGLINAPVSVGGGTGSQMITGGTPTSAGTLTLAGGLTINSGGIVYFNTVSTGTTANFINITSGNFTANAGAVFEVPSEVSGTYQLISDINGIISGTGNITLDTLAAGPAPANYTLVITGGTLELSVAPVTTAQPTITLGNLRVIMNQSGTMTGVLGNVAGGATLTGTLADNSPAGQLAGSGTLNVSSFPTNPVVVAAGTSANYTAVINNVGSNLGANIVNVSGTDGTNSSPNFVTATGTVSVLQNRIVSASAAALGSLHVGATGTASTSLTSPGADNANTRLTVSDGGTDSGTNGLTVTGGNVGTVFNGSTSDSRTVTGTFGGLGVQTGTVTLSTAGENLAGESDQPVTVGYSVQVFSGKASWASSTGGSWTNNLLWGDTQAGDLNGAGAPGLAGSASIGDTATFNDVSSQSGVSTVSLTGTTATLAGITFNSTNGYAITGGTITLQSTTPILVSTGSDSISSVLTGAGLNKTGSGTLSLGAGNSYTGNTQISNGVLQTTVTNALPITTTLSIGDNSNDSGQLVLGANQALTGGLTTIGTGTSNAVVGGVSGNSTLTLNLGGSQATVYTFNGNVGGGGANQNNLALVTSGSGIQILSGSITYTGTTDITGGVLQTSNMLPNTLITLTGANGASGGVWQPVLTGPTSYNFTLGGVSAGNVTSWTGGGFAAYGGVLTLTANSGATLLWGSGGFGSGGGGPLITFGSNTANNQVILTNNINLNTSDAFQQTVIVNGTTAGSSVLFSGQITQQTGTGAASGLKKSGFGTLILSNTTSNYSGAIVVEQGSLVAGGNSVGTGGGVFGTGTGTLATPTAPSAITLGDGTTVQGSNPSLLIGGAFTVDRNIAVTNNSTGVTYSIGGTTDNQATFSGSITLQTGTSASNAFDVSQVATTTGALNITGGIIGNGAAGQSVNFTNAGAVNVSGTIAGTGLQLIQSGTGTTTLTNANTYSGSTIISAGVLQLGNGTSGSDGTISSSLSILDNSSLVYDRFGSPSYNGVISGTGLVTVEGSGTQILTGANTFSGSTTISAGATLQLGDGTTGHDGTIGSSRNIGDGGALVYDRFGAASYSGTISGTGTVTLLGSGTQTLSGSNSYSGNTTIEQGNLSVTNTLGSATGSGTVNVAPNQGAISTLSGNGMISGPVVTAAASGGNVAHLAPGVNSAGAGGNFGGIGTLTLGNGLTIGNGTNLDFDLGTSSDLIVVTGQLTLGTGVVLNVGQAAGFGAGTYTLLTYTGLLTGDASTWTTAGLPGGETAAFSAGSGDVTVTISVNNNSTLVITPTPVAPSYISLGNVLVGSAAGSTTVTGSNSGTIGTGTFALATTGSAAVNPASTTLASSGTAGLTISSTGAISGQSGNNVVIGTVSATNSAYSSGSLAPVNVTANIYQTFSGSASTVVGSGTSILDLANRANSDGASGQRAGATIYGFTTNGNTNFSIVSTDNGGAVGNATGGNNSATVDVGTIAFDPSSNLLSGTYVGVITGSAQYTDTTLRSQQTIANQVWSTGTFIYSAPAAAYGVTLQAYVASGSSYAGYGLTSSGTGNTTAQLLAGVAGGNNTVQMTFGPSDFNSHPATASEPFVSSDSLTLTGLTTTGSNGPDGSIITDKFVLQLSYNVNANVGATPYYLGWYDTSKSEWVNATYGNDASGAGAGAYAESYAAYVASLPLIDQNNLGYQLGAYGYDSTNDVAWAVIDHESDFAVIPEPGTYAMIFSGFGVLVGFNRLRRRRSSSR